MEAGAKWGRAGQGCDVMCNGSMSDQQAGEETYRREPARHVIRWENEWTDMVNLNDYL